MCELLFSDDIASLLKKISFHDVITGVSVILINEVVNYVVDVDGVLLIEYEFMILLRVR